MWFHCQTWKTNPMYQMLPMCQTLYCFLENEEGWGLPSTSQKVQDLSTVLGQMGWCLKCKGSRLLCCSIIECWWRLKSPSLDHHVMYSRASRALLRDAQVSRYYDYVREKNQYWTYAKPLHNLCSISQLPGKLLNIL